MLAKRIVPCLDIKDGKTVMVAAYDDDGRFIEHKDITISNIKALKEKEIYTYGNNGGFFYKTFTCVWYYKVET